MEPTADDDLAPKPPIVDINMRPIYTQHTAMKIQIKPPIRWVSTWPLSSLGAGMLAGIVLLSACMGPGQGDQSGAAFSAPVTVARIP